MSRKTGFHIFILKSRANTLTAAENFLKNRQWQVASSTSLKQALMVVIRNKPDYLLLSVEHPNKKAAMLPKLLLQAFGLKVIPYSDSNAGSKTLQLMQIEHSLYAPVSGPSIERLILRAHKEDAEKAIENAEQRSLSSKDSQSTAPGVMVFSSDKDSSSAKDALMQFMRGDDGGEGDLITQEGIGMGQAFSETQDGSYYRRRKQKEAKYFSDPVVPTERKSILAQGASDAVDSSVLVKGGEPEEVLEQTSNVACVTIQSSRFSGYLLCALGKNKKIESDLIKTIQKKLFTFLRQSGEQVKDHENLDIEIKAVDFVDWSMEQAQFLKKSQHQGNELAMAFFPREKMGKEWNPPIENGMAILDIEDIPTDVSLDFNLYIHLPENNKFLLYTPEKSQLFKRQKDRLVGKGVAKVYVKEEAIQSLQKFQTQQYLNEMIQSYQAERSA
jgi:hypothetical protein